MTVPKESPTALFVSPHLDDVAFSCGGTLARLGVEGWRTVLATVFTKVVPDPSGFALECQLDKGLPPEADYMTMRREEDRLFAERVGVSELLWLDHPEAPHRGYGGAPAIFGDVLAEDGVWEILARDFEGLLGRYGPNLVFAPQALGGHVDHLHVVRALREAAPDEEVLWYRDTPYAIRRPDARPSPLLPTGLGELGADLGPYLRAKLDAVAAYETQLGFQFGGEAAMREALARFARREAGRTGGPGAAEAFLVGEAALRVLDGHTAGLKRAADAG